MYALSCYVYDESLKLKNSMDEESISKDEYHCTRCSSNHSFELHRFIDDAKQEPIYIESVGALLDETISSSDGQYLDQLEDCSLFDEKLSRFAKLFRGEHSGFVASYFVGRISRYTEASSCCFVTALIYLERLQSLIPSLRLTSWTQQRLLLVAVMIAEKYLEDLGTSNRRW